MWPFTPDLIEATSILMSQTQRNLDQITRHMFTLPASVSFPASLAITNALVIGIYVTVTLSARVVEFQTPIELKVSNKFRGLWHLPR